jgi:hypothetical protein
MFRMRFTDLRQSPGFGPYYTRFTRRPGWVWGTALLIGLLPFAVMIALLVVAALLTTAIVYAVLSGIHELLSMVGGGVQRGGRKNVRVVKRVEVHSGE